MSSSSKSNILMIWASDVRSTELGRVAAPNIDRLAREGMSFVHGARDPSAAAAVELMSGRSLNPLVRRGKQAAPHYRQRDATLASLLRARGYATGQFGGLRPEALTDCLVCFDGFDEIVRWSEQADYEALEAPPDRSPDNDVSELSDEEVLARAQLFMRRQQSQSRPFFAWVRTTHTHSIGLERHAQAAPDSGSRRLAAHDANIGALLDFLDDLELADETFVVYSADARAPVSADAFELDLPELATEEQPASHDAPLVVRWPGRIQAGSLCNGVVHCRDWLPTLLAVAGDTSARARLAAPHPAPMAIEECISGTNVLPQLMRDKGHEPAQPVQYFDDDGGRLTFRYDNWEVQARPRRAPLARRAMLAPRPGSAAPRELAASPAPPARCSVRRRPSRSVTRAASSRAPNRAGER